MEFLKPPVGTKVCCFFGPRSYRGEVIAHGPKHPKIRFRLKNGKVKEGPATVLPFGASTGVTYTGYLCQMYPNS